MLPLLKCDGGNYYMQHLDFYALTQWSHADLNL